MENDKNTIGKRDAEAQQPAQSERAPINPFRDASGDEAPQQSPEEETALEQQRKEAMTERD